MQVIEFKEFGSPSQLESRRTAVATGGCKHRSRSYRGRFRQPQRLEKCCGAHVADNFASHTRAGLFRRGGGWAEAVDRPGSMGFGR